MIRILIAGLTLLLLISTAHSDTPSARGESEFGKEGTLSTAGAETLVIDLHYRSTMFEASHKRTENPLKKRKGARTWQRYLQLSGQP